MKVLFKTASSFCPEEKSLACEALGFKLDYDSGPIGYCGIKTGETVEMGLHGLLAVSDDLGCEVVIKPSRETKHREVWLSGLRRS